MSRWEITLEYASAPAFITIEVASTLALAIAQAVRYAKACGWTDAPRKKFAKELTNPSAIVAEKGSAA